MNIYDSPNSWSPGKGSLDMLLNFSGFSYNIMCSRVDLVKRIQGDLFFGLSDCSCLICI